LLVRLVWEMRLAILTTILCMYTFSLIKTFCCPQLSKKAWNFPGVDLMSWGRSRYLVQAQSAGRLVVSNRKMSWPWMTLSCRQHTTIWPAHMQGWETWRR
jgi:hypothetical protein